MITYEKEDHKPREMITDKKDDHKQEKASQRRCEGHRREETMIDEEGTNHTDNRTCRREGGCIYVTVIKVGRTPRNTNWLERWPLNLLTPPSFFILSPSSYTLLPIPFFHSSSFHHSTCIIRNIFFLFTLIIFSFTISFHFNSTLFKPCA